MKNISETFDNHVFVKIEKVTVDGEGPSNRMNMSSIFYNKFIAVFGGKNDSLPIEENKFKYNSFYLLNLNSLSWEILVIYGFTPSPRYGHCMNIFNNKIIIWGGVTGNRFCSTCVYELETSFIK